MTAMNDATPLPEDHPVRIAWIRRVSWWPTPWIELPTLRAAPDGEAVLGAVALTQRGSPDGDFEPEPG